MPKYSSRCAERHELSLAGVQHDDSDEGFMHVALRSSIEPSGYYRLLNLCELGKRLYKCAGKPIGVQTSVTHVAYPTAGHNRISPVVDNKRNRAYLANGESIKGPFLFEPHSHRI